MTYIPSAKKVNQENVYSVKLSFKMKTKTFKYEKKKKNKKQ